jgi:hypothetical protein
VREIEDARRPRGPWLAAVLMALVTPSAVPAAVYGEVEVTVRSEPLGTATHGYAEIEYVVVNRSAKAHDVRLTFPKSSYSSGGDYLRAVSRTVTVEPGKTARAVLAYPERIEVRGGGGTGVAIDGREQEEPVAVGSGAGSRASSYGGYARSGRTQSYCLFSKTVDTRFPDWVGQAQREVWGMGGGYSFDAVRADQPADQWSTSWLGYTRYDGVAVTADDLRAMPAEVRAAVGQYVECGGTLLVFGRDPPLPGAWKLNPHPDHPVAVATPGFGLCVVTDRLDLSAEPAAVLVPALEGWVGTAAPWQKVRTANDANRAFPVVDDVGVPVKGLMFLMFVFVVVIGPLNLMVLARMKRKLWLFWTVPAISFATCVLVIGYMAVTEGWQGRSRVEGFTVLDENSRRASTLGWTGFYTPLLPSGGLHFGAETEVSYQNGEENYGYGYRRRNASGSPLTIDWSRDQHLASGWLTPRVPAHFVLRKSELRRERVTIASGADGAPEAVNGLGADLTTLWYQDAAGNSFRADGVPAGGRAALKLVPWQTPGRSPKTFRTVYGGDWSGLAEKLKTDGPALLAPRTYLAVMDAAPFLDDGLPGASVRKTRSVVYGILKEGGDGG